MFDKDGNGKGEYWAGDAGWKSTRMWQVKFKSYGPLFRLAKPLPNGKNALWSSTKGRPSACGGGPHMSPVSAAQTCMELPLTC